MSWLSLGRRGRKGVFSPDGYLFLIDLSFAVEEIQFSPRVG